MSEPDEKKTPSWGDIFGEEKPYPDRPEKPPIVEPSPPADAIPAPPKPRRGSRDQAGFDFTAHPVYNVRWDDLGIGMMQQMGYMPNRPIHVEVTKGKWIVTGARTNSPMLLFLALGAGGLAYLLQDLIRNIPNWGEIVSVLIILVPPLLNLLVRVQTLELFPFDLDLVGYDRLSHILVLSTVTEPGGVVAMRVDLPFDEKERQTEETKLIDNLRRSHTGFTLFDSRANEGEEPAIKQWSLRALIWVVIVGLAIWLYYMSK